MRSRGIGGPVRVRSRPHRRLTSVLCRAFRAANATDGARADAGASKAPEAPDGKSYINTAALRPLIQRPMRRADPVRQVRQRCAPQQTPHGIARRHWLTCALGPVPPPSHAALRQCYVIRNRSGRNMLHPLYTVYSEDGDRFLMAAKVRRALAPAVGQHTRCFDCDCGLRCFIAGICRHPSLHYAHVCAGHFACRNVWGTAHPTTSSRWTRSRRTARVRTSSASCARTGYAAPSTHPRSVTCYTVGPDTLTCIGVVWPVGFWLRHL